MITFFLHGNMEIISIHKNKELAYIPPPKKTKPSGKSIFEILASVLYYRNGYDADKV